MPEIQIHIVLTADGRVAVSGAIENKTVAYGLLETAKDAIREHHANANQRIVTPHPGMTLVPPPGQN